MPCIFFALLALLGFVVLLALMPLFVFLALFILQQLAVKRDRTTLIRATSYY